jgi:hypothetical protein
LKRRQLDNLPAELCLGSRAPGRRSGLLLQINLHLPLG